MKLWGWDEGDHISTLKHNEGRSGEARSRNGVEPHQFEFRVSEYWRLGWQHWEEQEKNG